MDAALAAVIARCRERWPELTVPDEAFLAHLRGHEGAAHLEDLWFACACARGDVGALRRLEQEWLPRLVPALRALRGPVGFVDEVLQTLRQKLLVGSDGQGRIGDYAGAGPLEAWLRAVAVRTALNARRDSVRDALPPASEVLLELPAHAQDPELQLLKLRFRPHFHRLLGEALALLPPRDRNVLRLHFVDGLSLSQISAGYQVDKSTVSRWISASRERLLAHIKDGLRAALALEDGELEGLFALVKSGLSLSLSAALRPPEGEPED